MPRARSIIRGRTRDGLRVTRHLSCGHDQPEMSGGRASTAEFAYCARCSAGEAPIERAVPVPPPPSTFTLQKAADALVTALSPTERRVLDQRFDRVVITEPEEVKLLQLAKRPELFRLYEKDFSPTVLDVARYLVGFDRSPPARIARVGDAIKAKATIE